MGFDANDSMGGDDDNYVDVDPSILGNQPQSVEDVVAQALPGSSGFQGVGLGCIIFHVSAVTIKVKFDSIHPSNVNLMANYLY